MAEWEVVTLERGHDRSLFTCGKPPLDEFLRSLVNQYERRHLGRTFVAVRPGQARVWGYYTLASGSVSFEALPADLARKLPRHPVPVVLLARLAVDRATQGQGLGAALMRNALVRSLPLAEQMGMHAVEVHALDEQARTFYQRYGFTPLLDSPFHLFLPVAMLRSASRGPDKG